MEAEDRGGDRVSDKVLWVDSREQWTQARSTDTHIKDYFEKHGIGYIVQKLDVGDYTYPGSNIAVDRKQNLDEVARNLTNRSDSSRFWREVRRAYEQHIQLVVLVESGPAVLSIKDVPKWKSKFSPVSGRTVQNEMIRLEQAYKVRWCFCSKRSTAKRIIELLDGKE